MASPSCDSKAALFWTYPSNYPPRDYQIKICQQALFQNTLVCLPTGLGKTLIAAVVMYNFYSWFPNGKIVFVAPSKPLVQQQILACHSIMGIPERDTAHLEGSVASDKRENLWDKRRVIFCTPQTLVNDIIAGRCDASQIVCLVVDEAHKATNNYAYTIAVQEISAVSDRFRVLALSATPGSDTQRIQNVIYNLRISHVEIRCEDDPELAPYRHERMFETVRCPSGASHGIQSIRGTINELMAAPLARLNAHGVLQCTVPDSLNMFVVNEAESLLRAWLEDTANGVTPISELSALRHDLLQVRHLMVGRRALNEDGVSALLRALVEMRDKFAQIARIGGSTTRANVTTDERFARLVTVLQKAQHDPQYLDRRQPKIARLKELLSEHFVRRARGGASTRVIVFSQLRATVQEIVAELGELDGVRAHAFIGQADSSSGKGLTQIEQTRVLRDFNSGRYNVLVATSIAEEGLDIAEVDLIVLFEVVASPIRLVQRCGRTGRKRSGRVVMLFSEGSGEEGRIDQGSEGAETITRALRNAARTLKLCPPSPPMLPVSQPPPQMRMQHMHVGDFHACQVAGSTNHGSGVVDRDVPKAVVASGGINGVQSTEKYSAPQNHVNAMSRSRENGSCEVGRSTGGSNGGSSRFVSTALQRSYFDDSWAKEAGTSECQLAVPQNASMFSSLLSQAMLSGGEGSASLKSSSSSQSRCADTRVSSVATSVAAPVCSIEEVETHAVAGNNRGGGECEDDLFGWSFSGAIAPSQSAAALSKATTSNKSVQFVALSTPPSGSTAQNKVSALQRTGAEKLDARLETSSQPASTATGASSIVPPKELSALATITVYPVDSTTATVIRRSGSAVRASERSNTATQQPAVVGLRNVLVSAPPRLASFLPSDLESSQSECDDHENESENENANIDKGAPLVSVDHSALSSGLFSGSDSGRIRAESPSASALFPTCQESPILVASSDQSVLAAVGAGPFGADSPASVEWYEEPVTHDGCGGSGLFGQGHDSMPREEDVYGRRTDNRASDGIAGRPPLHSGGGASHNSLSARLDRSGLKPPLGTSARNASKSIRNDSRILDLTAVAAKRSVPVGQSRSPAVSTNSHRSMVPQQQPSGALRCGSTASTGGQPSGSNTDSPPLSPVAGDFDSTGQCWVCLSAEPADGDPILFCDGHCGTSMHLSCYALDAVPSGNFFCDGCKALKNGKKPVCALCFQPGGLMRRSTCHQWVHILCVLFTPELTVDAQMRADNLSALDPDRAGLKCKVCKRRGGACIQCTFADCLEAFHPFCAYSSRVQQMVVREVVALNGTTNGQLNNRDSFEADGGMVYELYCKAHRGEVDRRHVVSSRNPLRDKYVHTHIPMAGSGTREESLVAGKRRMGVDYALIPGYPAKKARTVEQSRAARYFELEAALSGSDSGDEEEEDARALEKREGREGDSDNDEEDEVLSGNFINDGSFTQHSAAGTPTRNSGGGTSYGMYLAVNQYRQRMDSPDDFVRRSGGRKGINVRKLVRGGAGRVRYRNGEPTLTAGVEEEEGDSFSVLSDTPDSSDGGGSDDGGALEAWSRREATVAKRGKFAPSSSSTSAFVGSSAPLSRSDTLGGSDSFVCDSDSSSASCGESDGSQSAVEQGLGDTVESTSLDQREARGRTRARRGRLRSGKATGGVAAGETTAGDICADHTVARSSNVNRHAVPLTDNSLFDEDDGDW